MALKNLGKSLHTSDFRLRCTYTKLTIVFLRSLFWKNFHTLHCTWWDHYFQRNYVMVSPQYLISEDVSLFIFQRAYLALCIYYILIFKKLPIMKIKRKMKTRLKFIYSEKATKFCKFPPLIGPLLHRTILWWRFRKNVWPSQNIWTLS